MLERWIKVFFIVFLGIFIEKSIADTALILARTSDSQDATRFVFESQEEILYKISKLSKPNRIFVDFEKANLAPTFSDIDFSKTDITRIRSSRQANGDMRLVFDLKRSIKFDHFVLKSADESNFRYVIDFFKTADEKKSEKSALPIEKRKILIAIDPGHGGKDPGALGPDKIFEKNIVLGISKKIKNYFDIDPAFDAFLTRDGDYFLDHRKRSGMAIERKADLFISIHADAFPDPRPNGVSVYALSKEGSESEIDQFMSNDEIRRDLNQGSTVIEIDKLEEGVDLILVDLIEDQTLAYSLEAGAAVVKRLSRVANKMHKKKVERASFLVLKSLDTPSLLIETGFISNFAEAKRLSKDSYQTKLAKAIYSGISDYFVENQPLDAIAPTPVSEVPTEYIVSKGDTLSEIAARGGLDLDRLIDFNNLKNSNIFVGQKIRFPSDGYEISNETESESDMPSEYTVSRGDTLSEIAVSYGFKLNDLIGFNNLQNSNIFVGQKIRFPVGDYEIPHEIYIIKKGDTLSEIAQRFRISQGRLKYMNNSISDKIVVGQKLKIPREQRNTFKRSYLVKYGDTLSEIAQKYNTTTGELMFQNKLLKPDISVGQKLLIP
ncbi:MAG: LysM peptidoglycan-binding domain-containing protein [Pseudomonadota bacterium]|nr:LysM peptidoglycan-binding domain-containing protein [Pseudomonadota bacterium]